MTFGVRFQRIPYSDLMKELELDNTRELEDAIITAIYSGKIEHLIASYSSDMFISTVLVLYPTMSVMRCVLECVVSCNPNNHGRAGISLTDCSQLAKNGITYTVVYLLPVLISITDIVWQYQILDIPGQVVRICLVTSLQDPLFVSQSSCLAH